MSCKLNGYHWCRAENKEQISSKGDEIKSSWVWVFSIRKPLAVHKACPEALCEGLDPVVSQHHSLRHAQVELLLRLQNYAVGPCYWEQLLQQVPELLLRMVWCGEETGRETCTQEAKSDYSLNKTSSDNTPENVTFVDDRSPTITCVGLTGQINIGGPVASLVFEGADASTMKSGVFSLWVQVLWKHGQQAARKRQPAGHTAQHECSLHAIFAIYICQQLHSL